MMLAVDILLQQRNGPNQLSNNDNDNDIILYITYNNNSHFSLVM